MASNLSTLRNLTILTLFLLAVLAAAFILSPRSGDIDQPMLHKLGGDFTLNSVDGETSLQVFHGQIAALYIGYTSCPDVCPTALAVMSQALKDLEASEVEQIQPLFISVDPERDTPESLAKYSRFFHPKMIGLTGNREQIDHVVSNYGAFYRIVKLDDSAMGYAVDHSSRIYLINKQGELSRTLMHGSTPDELVKSFRQLISKS